MTKTKKKKGRYVAYKMFTLKFMIMNLNYLYDEMNNLVQTFMVRKMR